MAKVTSKLQVTLPKSIAKAHGIAPGDEIHFESAGEAIRIVTPGHAARHTLPLEERLRLFDAATRRLEQRAAALPLQEQPPGERDWQRGEFYTRGSG